MMNLAVIQGLRWTASGQPVPTPRRIPAERESIHEQRIDCVRRMGRQWIKHPCYVPSPRHSNDPVLYEPARAEYLAEIAARARADRARNTEYQRTERFRLAAA